MTRSGPKRRANRFKTASKKAPGKRDSVHHHYIHICMYMCIYIYIYIY